MKSESGTKSMRIRIRGREGGAAAAIGEARGIATKYLDGGFPVKLVRSLPDKRYPGLVWHEVLAGEA